MGSGRGGYISVSTDGGATWTNHGGSSGLGIWSSIASSTDGTHLAAANLAGSITVSTDGGLTWTNHNASSGPAMWMSIASSADGLHLAACRVPYVIESTDGGVTWGLDTGIAGLGASNMWYSIASSADGTHLALTDNVGTGNGGYIYTTSSVSGTGAIFNSGYNSGTGTAAGVAVSPAPVSAPSIAVNTPTGSSGTTVTDSISSQQPTSMAPLTISQNLAYGQTDPEIKTLQLYLITHGYLSGSATGFYGNLTKAAVKKLQAILGIQSTGVNVGPATRAALQKIK